MEAIETEKKAEEDDSLEVKALEEDHGEIETTEITKMTEDHETERTALDLGMTEITKMTEDRETEGTALEEETEQDPTEELRNHETEAIVEEGKKKN